MRPTTTTTALLLSALLLLLAPAAPAFNPQPEPPGSLPVGLTFDQTARVQVANAVDLLGALFSGTPDDSVERLACAVELSLVASDGETLLVVEALVAPGHTEGVELSGRKLGLGRQPGLGAGGARALLLSGPGHLLGPGEPRRRALCRRPPRALCSRSARDPGGLRRHRGRAALPGRRARRRAGEAVGRRHPGLESGAGAVTARPGNGECIPLPTLDEEW